MPAIVQSHSQSQAGLMFVTSLEMDNSDWWMHISHLSQIIGRAQRKKGWISTVFAFNRWNLALLPYKQWKHFLDLWPLQGIKRHPPFHWALKLCQHFFRATLRVRLDSCLSLLLKWMTDCTKSNAHFTVCLWEGLIHEWKHTLLAPSLPFMSVNTSQFYSTHNEGSAGMCTTV